MIPEYIADILTALIITGLATTLAITIWNHWDDLP